jgi:hypothetical protein
MKFTFGIITSGNSDDNLNAVIDSIEQQNIPEYQILIVGNSNVSRTNTFIIPFNESICSGWITRKKNIITMSSAYNNVVYTHDYVVFEPGWYEGFLQFGDDFKICMNKFVNPDYSRFRDWVIWPHNNNFMDLIVLPNRECLIPYDMTHLSKYQYIYFVLLYYNMSNREMNNFEQIITSIRNTLRVEGITGLDSVYHCIAFMVCRYLTISKCLNPIAKNKAVLLYAVSIKSKFTPLLHNSLTIFKSPLQHAYIKILLLFSNL